LDWLAVSILGFIVGALGFIVGAGELFVRYRDEPLRVLFSRPVLFYAIIYAVINALAALAALALIHVFGLTFGIDPQKSATELRVTRVLVATLGAMLFLRSSLFTVRIGDQDVAIGPSVFLQTVLNAVDRAVDRDRAKLLAESVSRMMKGVSYRQAFMLLPPLVVAQLQDVSPEVQERLAERLLQVDMSPGDDRTKLFEFGLIAANYVGVAALETAVNSIRPLLTQPGLEEFNPDKRVQLAEKLGKLTSKEREKFVNEALHDSRQRPTPARILQLVERIKDPSAKSSE
jgi:hypothetical protein